LTVVLADPSIDPNIYVPAGSPDTDPFGEVAEDARQWLVVDEEDAPLVEVRRLAFAGLVQADENLFKA
jgi:hypothetical protein